MNIPIIILIISVFGVTFYDFYLLKRSKVEIGSCFSSAGITLVVSLVVFLIGALIGLAIFGDDNEYWTIVSLVLVYGIFYFRFKGREIKKGKVKVEKPKKVKKQSLKENLVEVIAALLGIFLYKAFGLMGVGALGIGYGVYSYLNKRYNKYISVITGIIGGIIGYVLIVLIYFQIKS